MSERFFIAELPEQGRVILDGEEARHLARVLRLGPGAGVVLFDGKGEGRRAVVDQVLGGDRVALELSTEIVVDRVAAIDLTLATAVPKGDRFDWLVEKATELGVSRLAPIVSARSSVDPRLSKIDRLRKRVVEASKQCGRNRLMTIDAPIAWKEYLKHDLSSIRLIAHPSGEPIARASSSIIKDMKISLAIGPEGGFADEEVASSIGEGWIPAGLGATILRVETAAVAGCAYLLNHAGGENS